MNANNAIHTQNLCKSFGGTQAAWAMDGLQNIVLRGLGLTSTLFPAGILWVYTVVFFGLAVWRFRFE